MGRVIESVQVLLLHGQNNHAKVFISVNSDVLVKSLLLAHDAHFGIHEMLRSILKGLKQFGIFNPPEADKRSAFHELFPKSGQNRS